MIPKVSIGFIATDTDAELLVESGRILSAMLGNPNFTTPTPSLTAVGTARGQFADSVTNLDGGSVSATTRDEKRTAFAGLLRDLAAYVQGNCKNDLVILLSSGFPAQKSPQPVGPLPAPGNLRVRRPENSGTLKARVEADPHASTYEWQLTEAAQPAGWREACVPTTAASATFENLTPGVLYVVRCRVLGSAGRSDWTVSAPIMCV